MQYFSGNLVSLLETSGMCVWVLWWVLGFHGRINQLHVQWSELHFQYGFCSVTCRYLWFGYGNTQVLPHIF